MRPLASEHRIIRGIYPDPPVVLEMCPRCRTGPLSRPQPGVVDCYKSACTEPGDEGVLYVRADEVYRLIINAKDGCPRSIGDYMLEFYSKVPNLLDSRRVAAAKLDFEEVAEVIQPTPRGQ